MLWEGECRGNEATDHCSVQTPLSPFNSLMAFPYAVVECIPSSSFFLSTSVPLELTSYSFEDSEFSPAALISTKSGFLTSTSKFYSADLAIIIFILLCFFIASTKNNRHKLD